MALRDLTSRLEERNVTVYLAVGVLSLLKAIALRGHPRRARREVREGALFLGLGLVLRAYYRYRQAGETEDGSEPGSTATTDDQVATAGGDNAAGTARERPDGEPTTAGPSSRVRTGLGRAASRLVPTP